ncbi:helix-turn-helix transcriptional regulator [Aneurinibacillus sp. BA2021]|nr:helix-turn-helix transcriptional regulator [Aneurinibacillus sp. BA2021]
MTSPESNKRVPLGPTGSVVAENVKRKRGSMQYKELAERLAEVGRPIPALGLRRIEAGERRVDVDDLMALAVVFGVSPLTLLLPSDGSADLASEVTGVPRPVAHNVQWLWAMGEEPLQLPSDELDDERKRRKVIYSTSARPPIDDRGSALAEFRGPHEGSVELDERLIKRMVDHLLAQGFVAKRVIDGDD